MNEMARKKAFYAATAAAEQFAQINGWQVSRSGFSAETLAKGGMHAGRRIYLGPERVFDHPVYFRESRRAVAIVCQPYGLAVESARNAADFYGLEVHVPPNITASWHYPGWARFCVFTRPGATLRFLPEQSLAAA